MLQSHERVTLTKGNHTDNTHISIFYHELKTRKVGLGEQVSVCSGYNVRHPG